VSPFQGLVSRGGEARLFRLRVPTAGPLRLRLDAPPSAGDRFELHARFGTRPSRGSAAFQSTDVTAGGGLLVPYAAAGDWYVLLYAASVGFLPSPPRVYTLLATRPDVTLADVSPSRAGNTGTATLGVTGAGFGPGTAVSLVAAGGATFAASSTDVDSATALSATFDLRLVPPGVYDVRVDASPSASATLPAAFTVVAAGAPRLQTRLEMPSDLGRHATATIYVHYANTGDAPMPAPLLLLESADDDGSDRPLLTLDARRVAQGFWTTAAPEGFGNTVQFLASGRTPGVLLPGESATVPVYYAGLQPPWDFSDRRVELGLRIFRSSDATPIDWAALAAARPPQFDAETWRPLSANLRAIVGETWGGYVAMLDAQATALARQGEAVNDVGQLWNVALRRANGLAPFGTLDDAVDAFVPTPGIALAFGRTFSTTLSARHQAGPLGRGWWTPWQARLAVRPDGTVVIVGRDNSQRRFQPDSRRATAYFSLPNDHGTLSPLSAGGFILREADGTVSAFRPDGRPEYVQDPNGNRVTASYDGAGRLTALTHSAGQSLALAYNPAGLIESVTDSAGRTAEYTYDAANEHLVSVRWFDGRVTRYTYGGGGDAATAHALLSVRRPDDSVRHFTYDARGRLSGTYVNDHVGRGDLCGRGTDRLANHRRVGGVVAAVLQPVRAAVPGGGRNGPFRQRRLRRGPRSVARDRRRRPALLVPPRRRRQPHAIDQPTGVVHAVPIRLPVQPPHRAGGRRGERHAVRLRRQGQPGRRDLRRRFGLARDVRRPRQPRLRHQPPGADGAVRVQQRRAGDARDAARRGGNELHLRPSRQSAHRRRRLRHDDVHLRLGRPRDEGDLPQRTVRRVHV